MIRYKTRLRVIASLLFTAATYLLHAQTPPPPDDIATGISAVNNAPLKAWSNGNTVYIDFGKNNEAGAVLSVYNIIGQQIYKEEINGSGLYAKAISLNQTGYVILKVDMGGQLLTRKLFVGTR